MGIGLSFLIAILMIIGNAFFVSAEFGLIAARRSNIEVKALKGSKSAKITLAAMEQIALMLAGIQLGVTFCSVVLGAVGEPLLADILKQPLSILNLPDVMLHVISFVISLTIVSYFHVVIGEMIPKNIALSNPDRMATLLTPILVIFIKLTRPIVVLLSYISNLCLGLIGVKPQKEIASTFSRDEVAGFIEESKREGLLSSDESDLLASTLYLDERKVSSILIPVSDLASALDTSTPTDIEKLVAKTGFSRFVIRDKDDQIVGYVHIKDILQISHAKHDRPISQKNIRPITSISEDDSLRKALIAMQKSGSHIAKVVDKSDSTIGAIMLEDVLEELVGEIRDDGHRVAYVD